LSKDTFEVNTSVSLMHFKDAWPHLYYNEDLQLEMLERNYPYAGGWFSLVTLVSSETVKQNKYWIYTLRGAHLQNRSFTSDHFLYNMENRGKPIKLSLKFASNDLKMLSNGSLSFLADISTNRPETLYITGIRLNTTKHAFIIAETGVD